MTTQTHHKSDAYVLYFIISSNTIAYCEEETERDIAIQW